jgi:hypothetical protein
MMIPCSCAMSRLVLVSFLRWGCSVSSILTTGCGSAQTAAMRTETWTDPATSLMWQQPQFTAQRAWADATEACAALELAGYADWRLPTLDELRSVARGCAATVTDGACGVTDNCLETTCSSAACDGCEEYGGLEPDGCYRPASFTGDCMTTWTSSIPPDMLEDAWTVGFGGCHVRHFPKTQDNLNTRCVR